MRGATSIAPMITAGLLSRSPRAASTAASPIITKKSARDEAPSRIVTLTSSRSSGVSTGSASVSACHVSRTVRVSQGMWRRAMITVPWLSSATRCGTSPKARRSISASRDVPISTAS